MRPFALALLLSLILPGCGEKQDTSPAAPAEASQPLPGAPEGMVWIAGATYTRGEDRKLSERANYPEEQPVHKVTVDGFFLDLTEVTNAQYLVFAEETGYLTQAERGWSKDDFPNAPDEMLVPGAMLFVPPTEKVALWQPGAEWSWWKFVPGANWRHPNGPQSSIAEIMDHPAVCITHKDAQAYAKWANKRLPTEAEWELAARGGLDHAIFTWGDRKTPDEKWLANAFQGEFPHHNTAIDGFAGTAPVRSYPPNGFGLYDMSGNVWEHCRDYYRPDYYREFSDNPHPNPTGPGEPIDDLRLQGFLRTGQWPEKMEPPHPLSAFHVVKGGSFLCHESYCLRFRPAARHYTESLAPTNHTGFRCARSGE